jgi:hypothetical protein
MSFAKPEEYVWQDREIRFDTAPVQLECRKGEVAIDSINSVEDTKGNNGARGSLIVTNLRIMWVAHNSPHTNLSVGLNCVVSVNIRKAKSKLRGTTQALCLIAKFSARFEFIFTSLVMNSPRLFTTVQTVLRAYETSKMYRELKLRGSIIKDGALMMLPLEQQYSRYTGVMNLSADQVRTVPCSPPNVISTFLYLYYASLTPPLPSRLQRHALTSPRREIWEPSTSRMSAWCGTRTWPATSTSPARTCKSRA